jgi:membrane protease YdiL (CAAX protease family)
MHARDRRHAVPWEWFDAVIAYFAWVVLSTAAAFAVLSALGEEGPTVVAAQILVSVALLVLVTLGWVSIRGLAAGATDAVRRAFGPKRPVLGDALRGVGYGIAAFVVVQLGLGLLVSSLIGALGREVPQIQEEVQSAVQGAGASSLLVALAVAVLAPLGEELLYRGVLYQALAQRMPGWPAIGLSGLAFGLTHVEPFVIVLTFPLGMALGWMVRRSGTLVVPYVAHVVFNAIGVALIRAGGT